MENRQNEKMRKFNTRQKHKKCIGKFKLQIRYRERPSVWIMRKNHKTMNWWVIIEQYAPINTTPTQFYFFSLLLNNNKIISSKKKKNYTENQLHTQGFSKITLFCYCRFVILFSNPSIFFLNQSEVMGCVKQHLKRAFRTVVIISFSAFSSILTTSGKGGRTSGFASQQRVMISVSAGRQSFGIIGLTPLFTTANAACTAVIFWNGSNPVMSSHMTMPKLYTSTLCV